MTLDELLDAAKRRREDLDTGVSLDVGTPTFEPKVSMDVGTPTLEPKVSMSVGKPTLQREPKVSVDIGKPIMGDEGTRVAQNDAPADTANDADKAMLQSHLGDVSSGRSQPKTTAPARTSKSDELAALLAKAQQNRDSDKWTKLGSWAALAGTKYAPKDLSATPITDANEEEAKQAVPNLQKKWEAQKSDQNDDPNDPSNQLKGKLYQTLAKKYGMDLGDISQMGGDDYKDVDKLISTAGTLSEKQTEALARQAGLESAAKDRQSAAEDRRQNHNDTVQMERDRLTESKREHDMLDAWRHDPSFGGKHGALGDAGELGSEVPGWERPDGKELPVKDAAKLRDKLAASSQLEDLIDQYEAVYKANPTKARIPGTEANAAAEAKARAILQALPLYEKGRLTKFDKENFEKQIPWVFSTEHYGSLTPDAAVQQKFQGLRDLVAQGTRLEMTAHGLRPHTAGVLNPYEQDKADAAAKGAQTSAPTGTPATKVTVTRKKDGVSKLVDSKLAQQLLATGDYQ